MNSLKKELILLFLSMTLILTNGITVFASELDNNIEPVDTLQNSDIIVSGADGQVVPRIGGSKTLSVPLKQQMNWYYCGPTSVRMVLLSKGIDKEQSFLAAEMNTDTSGTIVYRVRDCLNHYLGAGAYKYILTSQYPFAQGLVESIDNNKPVICHVQTSKLPIYQGHESGHYVVAYGYTWGTQGTSGTSIVKYNDPNNNNDYFGRHEAKWSEMNDAINYSAGYYIMSN